jgi:hypothetical protein
MLRVRPFNQVGQEGVLGEFGSGVGKDVGVVWLSEFMTHNLVADERNCRPNNKDGGAP